MKSVAESINTHYTTLDIAPGLDTTCVALGMFNHAQSQGCRGCSVGGIGCVGGVEGVGVEKVLIHKGEVSVI